MSITVGETTYDSNTVTNGIKQGNAKYNASKGYNTEVNELTQTEMDEIIDHAKDKGIEVVPMLNTPGHMYTILSAMKNLGISAYYTGARTSEYSMDLDNTTAVAFTKALLTKYVAYFQKNDCKFFHIGTDEYANDAYDGMGFPSMGANTYGKYAEYVNEIATVVKNDEMTPRAWNDGIHYTTYSEKFDENLQITYWSSGWLGGYEPAAASALAALGHGMINTHGDYYYVIGKNLNFENTGLNYANNWSNTQFMGSAVSNPVGAMFCIWSDEPDAKDETTVAKDVRLIMRAMAQAMNGQTVNVSEDVVPGGFNADGSINSDSITLPNPGTGNGTGTTTENIELTVGETHTITLENTLVEGAAQVQPAAPSVASAAYETHNGTGGISETETTRFDADGTKNQVIKCGNNYLTISDDGVLGTTTDPTQATIFTVTSQASGSSYVYSIRAENEYYLLASTNPYKLSTSKSDSNSAVWSYDEGFCLQGSITNFYLTYQSDGDKWMFNNFWSRTHAYSVTSAKQGTTITITGEYPGSTTLTVAGKTYNIKVNHKTNDITVYTGSTTTDTQTKDIPTGSTAQYGDNGETYVGVTFYGKEVTFTGMAIGQTTVTIGDTIYRVTVADEAVMRVDPRTVEYWITNARAAKSANEKTVTSQQIAASEVNSEDGKLISDLVPKETVRADDVTKVLDFWQGRYLLTDKQTHVGGVDQTRSGDKMARIRYWDSQWSYQNEQGTWNAIATNAQLVAYYLQVTDVTQEITTEVVDWGLMQEMWTANYLSENNYVLLDYTVKYESSNAEMPNEFPSEKSLAFHCDDGDNNTVFWDSNNSSYYRRLGATRAVNSSSYEVYLITATPTSDRPSEKLENNANQNTSYTYNGTEKVVWAKTEADYEDSGLEQYTSISGEFTYSEGGDPVVPGIEIYRQQGMKITYYVRAKATADSLTVHYVDNSDGKNEEFYSYNIAVENQVAFNSAIALPNTEKQIGNLVNSAVQNNLDKTQIVTSDLSMLPAVAAKYRFVEYEATGLKLENGNKDLYIYYTFSNYVDFVVDFGLPFEIEWKDLTTNADGATQDITLGIAGSNEAKFGTVTVEKNKIVYTPTSVITDFDMFTVSATGDTRNENGELPRVDYIVNVYPANNVMYEETFATQTGWETAGAAKANAKQETPSTSDVYGYDQAYKSDTTFSNGSALTAKVTANGTAPHAQFTFTGTGLEIMGECGSNTGVLLVGITNASDKGTRVYIVDTYFNGQLTNGEANPVDVGMTYQIPVVHDLNLRAGEHTVDIYGWYLPNSGAIKAQSGQAAVQVASDGLETVDNNTDLAAFLAEIGYADAEVEFISMNEELGGSDQGVAVYANQLADNADGAANSGLDVYFDGFRVYNTMSTEPEAYVEKNATFTSLYDVVDQSVWNDTDKTGTGIVFVEDAGDGTISYNEYKNSGPQNEIYLGAGQTLLFKVTEGTTAVQVSAKAIQGEPNLNESRAITTQTEMYYTNVEIDTAVSQNTVKITNTEKDGSILSLVDLKIIDGEIDTESVITAQEIEAAILGLQNPTDPDDSDNGGDNGNNGKPGDTDQPGDNSNTGKPGDTDKPGNNGNTGKPGDTDQPGDNSNTGKPGDTDQPGNNGNTGKPSDPTENWENPFTDVNMQAWYAQAIRYLSAHGIVNGLPGGIFGIENETTRSMVVTMLYRLAGSPKVEGTVPFDDVAKGAWYETAALWAYQTGIVKGYAEGRELLFKPDQAITRQEFVTMLYRYVTDYKKMDVSIRSDLDTYTDKDQVQPWALDAMKWAVDNGIMNGYNEGNKWYLRPVNKTRRSEMAKLFYGLYGYLDQN